MKVGFIGLGKLGMIAAEVMAEHYDVTGYDLADVSSESVQVKHSVKEAVAGRDIIFVAVPTPHDKEYGGDKPCMHLAPVDFDYSIVTSVLTEINKHVNMNQLVVLISTVLPGTTRSQLRPCITNSRFIYNPYLIAMGSVAWDMVNPEMVIIGTDDGEVSHDAKILTDFYKPMLNKEVRFEIGTWDEAESIKIFYNTFISTKIGLVNMIQDVAEKNGNINVDIVTNALAASSHRITGPAYMKAGLGDAGGCHPRDNIALRYLAQKLELGYDMFEMVMRSREVQAENMAKKLVELATKNDLPIWIHGKAFKPNVPYIDGSYSLLVGYYIRELSGIEPKYVDPMTGDLQSSIKGVILMAHHAPTTYGNTTMEPALAQSFYCAIESGSVILDPWRYLSKKAIIDVEVVYYGNTR